MTYLTGFALQLSTESMVTLLPALVLLIGAALVWPLSSTRRDLTARSGRLAVAVAVIAFLTALGVTIITTLPTLAAMSLIFATALVIIVAAFSSRHLDGDPHRDRYDRLLLATSGAAVLTLATPNLVIAVGGWIAAGAGVSALIAHHRDIAATHVAVREVRRARLIGDSALVAATALIVSASGATSFNAINAWAVTESSSAAIHVAGVLLVIAIASRCGLLPFSRWVPLSVVAPAPVCALLHAGVVNAPVILVLNLIPFISASQFTTTTLLVTGLTTALATFPRLLVRADAKTRLAWSTTAQMGFMVTLVAVGAYAAAVVHLLGHGIYKAIAFLWAGEQINEARKDPLPRTSRKTQLAGGVGGGLFALTVLAADSGWQHPVSAVVVLVATTAAGYALMSLRAKASHRIAAGFIAAIAVVSALMAVWVVADFTGLPKDAANLASWITAGIIAVFAIAMSALRDAAPIRAWAVLHRLADPTVTIRSLRGKEIPGELPPLPRSDADRAQLDKDVRHAAQSVPPAWGWQAFVAANPFEGMRHLGFTEAVQEAQRRGLTPLLGLPNSTLDSADDNPERQVDSLISGWLAAWTNTSSTPWPAPDKALSFWAWFRRVATADPVFTGAGRNRVAKLPDDAADALLHLHPWTSDGSDDNSRTRWARTELLRLPGWSGYLSRREAAAGAIDADALVHLLAIRAATRHALGLPTPVIKPATEVDDLVDEAVLELALSDLRREEDTVRSGLAAELRADQTHPRGPGPDTTERRIADLVFCIDVRSEPLRRHVEQRGAYHTKGFAGFFGLPVSRVSGTAPASDRFPVLIGSAAQVREADPADAGIIDLTKAALSKALSTPGGGFAAVDVAAIKGLIGAARLLVPGVTRVNPPSTRCLPDVTDPALVAAAVSFTRATGISGPDLPRVVVLVGHGSTSTNNPAASAFDCGACGGHRGAFNARVATTILNSPTGRNALRENSLVIPDDTVFVAGEHDTALDTVQLLDLVDVPLSHRDALTTIRADLAAAGAACAAERCRTLPGSRTYSPPAKPRTHDRAALRHVRRRALDASEVRHEWGLAGNAFFIAGPRSITAGLDLGGRAFLHDYDAENDPSGALLETIMTAPMVVAHWINSQYFFSTADPQRLGSGSKTAHNPVGALGVLAGPGGDLRVGLAEQSVRHGGQAIAPPVRLLAVIAASQSAVDAVLAQHPQIADLITGEWLSLCVIDPTTGEISQRTTHDWATPSWAKAPQPAAEPVATQETYALSNSH
ncbi:MAG: putative inorganic carbon transporter subunit DabA [Actinomycetota bacterium]